MNYVKGINQLATAFSALIVIVATLDFASVFHGTSFYDILCNIPKLV